MTAADVIFLDRMLGQLAAIGQRRRLGEQRWLGLGGVGGHAQQFRPQQNGEAQRPETHARALQKLAPVRRFYGPAKRRSKLTRGGLDAFRHGQQKQQQERYQRARNPPRQRRRQYRVGRRQRNRGEAPSDPAGVIGEGQRVESQHGAAHGEPQTARANPAPGQLQPANGPINLAD